jgi:choline dehydrogenase-like flavoprotein
VSAERFEAIVVGSGAGGGLIAGELADAGRRVLVLEAGPHRTAADFTRWEAHANHDIWWPPTLVEPRAAGAPPLAVIRGRCVGGTTTVNTKVALRPSAEDYARWHEAAGLLGATGEPFGEDDLLDHLQRVERRLGVRERTDWQTCVTTVAPGFEAHDAPLEAVMSYTDHNCMRCGSCLQGCPTNAGKNTMNVYLQPPWAEGRLALRAGCTVTRVVIEDRGTGPEATGVEFVDADGQAQRAEAEIVVVAGGAMATSHLLLRSGVGEAAGGSPSASLIGHHIGWHPARIIVGRFAEPQDAHMVYPITAHCMRFQSEAAGGFIVEASTIQDPIGFGVMLCDEDGRPMWGQALAQATRDYRYYSGLLTMVTDHNHGRAWVDESGRDRWSYDWDEVEIERDRVATAFARDVLRAAGADRVLPSAQSSTHVQGGCRMGTDPERSVVDAHGESHDVRRLFVGDSSVVPCTLSVNPSLTIMALATRLAEHLDADPKGYLDPRRAGVEAPA